MYWIWYAPPGGDFHCRRRLVADYRGFRDVPELKDASLIVAVMKFNTLQDHCVAILGVETNCVSIGDPLSGLDSLSIGEFEDK